MARIPLGDIVPMHPTGTRIGGTMSRPVGPGATDAYPRVPSLPSDLADAFWSNYSGGNTIPAYAGNSDAPPSIDTEVEGGPFFVGAQPNYPAPFSGNPALLFRRPFGRTTIIPNRRLPVTLKRDSQILTHKLFEPTEADLAILQESGLWRWISEHGGLQTCCNIPELGAPIYAIPPWIQKPNHGIDYKKIFFQPLTAFQTAGVFNSTDTVVGQWTVDSGFDGVIAKVIFGFDGNGHEEGSGDIVWRLKVGQRFARDLGNVLNTYGSLQTALLVQGDHIQLISGQTVQLIANIPAASPVTGGRVFAGTFGWIYGRR